MSISRALSAIAAAAFGAALMMALPGFSPPVKADTSEAVAAAPVVEIKPANECSEQTWPYFTADCLRHQTAGRTVRLVTLDRLPK